MATFRRNMENPTVAPAGDFKRPVIAARKPLNVTRRQPLGAISNQSSVKPLESKEKISLKPEKKVVEKPISKVSTRAKLAPKKSESLTAVLNEKVKKSEATKAKETVIEPEVKPSEPEISPPAEIPDVDQNDLNNPQYVSIYVNKIYDYLRSVELEHAIKEDFLNGRLVTGRMRGIILDWLYQVCNKFELLPETFYLTVDIFDRFLQMPDQCVHKSNLQLIGVSSLFIATKYEEMYSPPIGDYVYITDRSCSDKDIRLMEIKILKALGFFLGKPTPLQFLRRNSKVAEVDVMTHTLAKYLLELCVIDYSMAHHRPSAMAAAALCLSLRLLNNTEWSPVLVHHSKYTFEEISPIVNAMAKLVVKSETAKLQAVRIKYGSSKMYKISLIPELRSDIVKSMAALAI